MCVKIFKIFLRTYLNIFSSYVASYKFFVCHGAFFFRMVSFLVPCYVCVVFRVVEPPLRIVM
jgi:hypothetical protein